ncbi:MAG: hypothetical protein ACO3QV_02190 [Candidatus Nanopelagicaceae bacterium]
MGGKHAAGKGDRYRKVDLKKYAENYDKIFGKKKKKTRSSTSKRKVDDGSEQQ